MTIPALRVPFVYAEFDPSRAFQGPAILRYKTLLIGQRTSGGSVAQLVLKTLSSADKAAEYFGNGSMLHRMAIAYFANNKITETYAIALDDNGAGVAATGTFTITGPATADGTMVFYVAGTRLPITVTSADTATDIGDALEAAITADVTLPVSAANVAGTVTLTAKNKGEAGNDIDMRTNYYADEIYPAGTGNTTVGMASGATNPLLSAVIAVLGDTWYNIFICPLNDATNMTAMETELADRFSYSRMIDGLYITSKTGVIADLTTYGNGRNSPHVVCMHSQLVATYIGDFVGAVGGNIALEGEIDPARPFQTLELIGILPPGDTERFTTAENDTLLFDGIATFYVDQSNKVRIQRAITMYQTNDAGAADTAYLDANTLLTLMYLRYDFRTTIETKYSRAKLADDGTNFGAGNQVITPKIGKAEAVAKFRQWEAQGLVDRQFNLTE
jgi:phage tail sheath gpL-like